MKSRRLWGLIIMAGWAAAATVAAERRNVIIVLTDDQGYGDLGCHGNPAVKTPNLDRLHGESVRFTDFHSAPVCTPTRGQLLTGRDAMHNGAWSWAYGHEMMHLSNRTMADIFRANGYRTGIFGKWHLGDNAPWRPQDRGFDESVVLAGAATHQTPDYWQNDNFDDYYLHTDGVWRQHEGYCTDVWFDLSMDFMRRCRDAGQPFMVYLPTNAPHGPHYVAEKYAGPYRDLEVSGRGAKNLAPFFGMIANIDENMGRLEEFLQAEGLRDDTIFVYMTDNGGTAGVPFYNAGMRGKKGAYYDGGHRVPCFWRWPGGGLGSPRDIDVLTQVQDVLPTLVDLCGLRCDAETQKRFDGVSLMPLLRGQGSNEVFDERILVVQWSPLDFPTKADAAVMWRKWRLVHGRELYDMAADPEQNHDVGAIRPEIREKLKRHYERWWASVQSVVSVYSRIEIGGREDPVRLTCFDWTRRETRANVTQQTSVWQGEAANGTWGLAVAKAGRYRFSLRRYPREAAFPMAGAFPETRREFRTFPECKALPIAGARIRIGEIEKTVDVSPRDTAAVFEVDLPAGEVDLKTWLLDREGGSLSGAYYVDVERL